MAAPSRSEAGRSPGGSRAHAALSSLLSDLAALLLQVPPPVYSARLLPGASGSIGEHVRHVLDHVAAFVGTAGQQVLTYDHRERGTAVELDGSAALRAIMRLKGLLDDGHDDRLENVVTIAAVIERGAAPVLMRSTRRRELAFVISHTIHHQALIAVLLATAGQPVPAAFGLAPSTPTLSRT
jgi:uncharacterized damage-inducible protein DinB